MMPQLKISARNAGQVELAKFCPRCSWYLLRMKKMPFQFGMPGILFYLEHIEKDFIFAYLSKFGTSPAYFGPFADCFEPVEFPFSMCQEHAETGVLVTARPDMILRKADGNLCLLDLKTSKPDGGGNVFLPQYEVQVIGYSWVVQEANIGEVGTTGLLYADVQMEKVLENPLKYKTDTGFTVPFDFKAHEVKIDYSRLTRCLKEMNKLWNAIAPPMGVSGCKDCQLLTRFVDFENNLRITDQQKFEYPEYRRFLFSQESFRQKTRPSAKDIEEILSADSWDPDGGMWANWDFS